MAGDELADLRERVAALLPGQDLTARDAPDPGSLDLPARRVVPPATLAGLCRDDPVDRAAHAHGKAFRDVVRNLHGDLRHVPDVVARPRTEQDLVDLLDWCATDGISVIPYGGGSSVVGGVEPRFDGPAVTVDLTRLDRVLEVDATSRAARIQGGVLGPHLEEQLKPHGLTLRHFPQSFEFSTLGGWLATRAGGHFATVYTHIDDLVESLRVVTPAGTSESRRLPASGAGPSPDRLFLGSEGSLGVITEAWMRLQARPRWRASASVHFEAYDAAVAATRAIAQSGLYPANCRLLDAAEAFLNAGTSVGRRRTGAGLRVRRPSGRRPAGPGAGAVPGPRWHKPAEGRGVRDLAVVVPADAVPAGRAGPDGHDRRDVRDRLHLGPVREPVRRRHAAGARCHPRGGGSGCRHLPVHARVSGRAGAVLRGIRRRALGQHRRAVGRDQGSRVRDAARARRARSRTTTRSAGTTRPGTNGSARRRTPQLSERPSRPWTRPACSTPGCWRSRCTAQQA